MLTRELAHYLIESLIELNGPEMLVAEALDTCWTILPTQKALLQEHVGQALTLGAALESLTVEPVKTNVEMQDGVDPDGDLDNPKFFCVQCEEVKPNTEMAIGKSRDGTEVPTMWCSTCVKTEVERHTEEQKLSGSPNRPPKFMVDRSKWTRYGY